MRAKGLITATALTALLALTACSALPTRPAMPDAFAPPPATQGVMAERIDPAQAQHPGESGFRLVTAGTEAYALRTYSAQIATRSLDIQTYIWHGDLTGKLLARRALDAADRGVQVRILVDDMDARARNAGFAALDAHERIEVRVFNPFASRSGTLRRIGEMATGLRRLNHRMHNKSWIADNRMALVGGRNLGDEYFNASPETNFVDLDLLMVGPVVPQVSANFDRYWNAPSNYPISAINKEPATAEALAKARAVLAATPDELARSPYAMVLREDPDVQRLIAGEGTLLWSRDWAFVSDDPYKVDRDSDGFGHSAVLAAIGPATRSSRQALRVISPYFVPGREGTRALLEIAATGVDVDVLTNSLAATDVAAVHSGYSRARKDLLAGGVELWELKPTSGAPSRFSLGGSSGSSLHTKALVIDDRQIFVGSYNLDPRSTSLNTEQGVLVSHPQLAQQLAQIFEAQRQGTHAWQVQKVDGSLQWSDGTQTWTSEPEATMGRRMQVWLAKLLPIQSQL
jgi:putative cardiolipin synthase